MLPNRCEHGYATNVLYVHCPKCMARSIPGADKPYEMDFLEHMVNCSSQYDSTCRHLALELIASRRHIESLEIVIATYKGLQDKQNARSYGFIGARENRLDRQQYESTPELLAEYDAGAAFYHELRSKGEIQ